ncbi:hypothetical protein BP6252_07863 [Coleophoma cylindrospora]|uniref:Nuclear RNA binding protein n=1 Tax=Coleophoma cylindrospora TaxID=1849047 RepID=A0A3D8RBE3_9HELO|nr:hypothetical protein BP6252_07863 [Coleophoma cylindrospora]
MASLVEQEFSRDSFRPQAKESMQDMSALDPTKKPAKRLFSTRSALSDETDSSDQYGEHGENTLAEGEYSNSKRRRSANWPLANTSPNAAPAARSRRASRKSPPSRSDSERARASKFIEGSMNDRVSQKPPVTYIGSDEDLRDNYDSEQALGGKTAHSRRLMHHPDSLAAPSAVTDTSRQSGIFRFGKSLAATFNPSNWKIWSKDSRCEESAASEQEKVMRERQEKAQRMYKELKESGYFQDGAHSGSLQHAVAASSSQKIKHDSGVEFGPRSSSLSRQPMSIAEKRQGRIFQDPALMAEATPAGTPKSVVSPANSSARKSFQFRKPSLPNIRRSLDFASGSHEKGSTNSELRKIPSRRDLKRQQKLVKRVSDLEGKLEAARRQLSEALAAPVPVQQFQTGRERSRFVPGALPTLPSERLLSGYVQDEDEDEILAYTEQGSQVINRVPDFDEIGKALTLDGNLSEHYPGPIAPAFSRIVTSERALLGVTPILQDEENIGSEKRVPSQQSVFSKKDIKYSQPIQHVDSSTLKSAEEDIDHGRQLADADELKPSIERDSPAVNPRRKVFNKRKSIFDGLSDDSGIYRPSSNSENEDHEPPEKKTPPMKKARKSQELIKEPPSTPDHRETQAKNQRQPASRHLHLMNSSASSVTAQSIRKPSKIPLKSSDAQQSSSPPPSSEFVGLDSIKSSHTTRSLDRMRSRNVLRDQDDTEPYSVVPGDDTDVPPIPKLPKEVKLAGGGILKTAISKENRKMPGNSPERNIEKQPQSKKSFEWERDVF